MRCNMQKDLEYLYPHASDVYERKTLDNGFSDGWGMHFIPITDKWINCHTHVLYKSNDDINNIFNSIKNTMPDVVHTILCTPPVISKNNEHDYSMDLNRIDSFDVLNEYLDTKNDSFDISAIEIFLFLFGY